MYGEIETEAQMKQLRKVDIFDGKPFCGHCGGSVTITLTDPWTHVLSCTRCERTARIETLKKR